MREFMLNSENLFDAKAYEALINGSVPGILSCRKVAWNDRIQLVYFTTGLENLNARLDSFTLDDIRETGCEIVDIVKKAEDNPDLCCENLVIDMESIYLDEEGNVLLTLLPAVLPDEIKNGEIYKRRVYSVIEEMLQMREGGGEVVRQIEFQQNKSFGNWDDFKDALMRKAPAESETITLKGINTSVPLEFTIGHEVFRIGSDPEQVEGCIPSSASVSPVHALIGWNDVSFYVQDLNSREGTYLNDVRLTPSTSVPFGKGSVLKFAECTFSVE